VNAIKNRAQGSKKDKKHTKKRMVNALSALQDYIESSTDNDSATSGDEVDSSESSEDSKNE
jgi:hypothetical protein